jgi:molybdate transport system substrate-binding protein
VALLLQATGVSMARLLALAAVLSFSSPAGAQVPAATRALSVAAAANLKAAIEELGQGFEREQPGVRVSVTTGASGAFVAQILNSAPFDVFFSADRDYPRKLAEAGLGAPGGEIVYAIGRLAVWAPRGSPLDLERKGVAALADPAVKKLAISNPAIAPYGRAAEAALRAAGVYEAVKDRLVLGQNTSQTAQFAQSGAADAALVPLSLTLSPELRGGKVHTVPPSTYPALEQSAIVLAGAKEPALALAFVRFVTGPRGREILARHGYGLP